MKLQRSAPEKQGVKSQAVVDFLNKIKEEKFELHSFMLLKNGKVISECWWEPYGPQYRHQLFSLSKSFTSTAIGLAVNEGLLTVDTLVADIFKQEVGELGADIDEKMKKMTVRHLLMMGTGMEYENWAWDGNNIKGFLSSHIKNEPGSVFYYHTLATYMQSAVITRLTGLKLVDYLKPRLFDPLDIDPYWEEDNLGISMGGFGLNITTEDIAKFGQLYLQKGNWNGKQLIPESWVDEATGKHIDNATEENAVGDWAQGYGYQFWRCKPDGVYRGDGAYGQFCIVMPNENAVVAITSNADMQGVMNVIWDILYPALRENNDPCEDKPARNKLLQAQKNLSHLWIDENASDFPIIRGLYKIDEKAGSELSDVYLDFNAADGILSLNYNNKNNVHKKECVYRFKKGEWVDNASKMFMWGARFLRSKLYGEWKPEENTFYLYAWFYETPSKNLLKLKFNKNKTKLTVVFHENYTVDFDFVKGSDICAIS